jgi:2,3-bisphosphoglycerate-independent phosphoglycerate mutase
MKYVIVIPDGCADEPQESLSGKTPLQAARVPWMDAIAKAGIVGRSNNVPPHLPAGSAVANISLLGYDPSVYFTGRAPLEAAAQGIELGEDDWAIRCNLVTVEDQTMSDFTADHISSEEAKTLLEAFGEEVQLPNLEIHPGVSYRNLLVFRGEKTRPPFTNETRSTPPHDLTDKKVLDDFPRGPGSDLLNDWMGRSVQVFADHPINVQRLAAGRKPATNVWLWGLGKAPQLQPFAELYGKTGKMITAVDLLRGIARLIGWDVIEVPGATGYTDTDYAAKGQHAIAALDSADLICVHVEATDEASHEGDTAAKIAALEAIDQAIVGPLYEELGRRGEDYRILVTPDHPTPVRTKTHSHGIVPFTICGAGIDADSSSSYDELQAEASSIAFTDGHRLMSMFLAGTSKA